MAYNQKLRRRLGQRHTTGAPPAPARAEAARLPRDGRRQRRLWRAYMGGLPGRGQQQRMRIYFLYLRAALKLFNVKDGNDFRRVIRRETEQRQICFFKVPLFAIL